MSRISMKCGIARTHFVSGRFRRLTILIVTVVSISACQTVGTPPLITEEVEPIGPPPLVVTPGVIAKSAQEEAGRLWSSAQASFEAQEFSQAVLVSEEIVTDFPSSSLSGEALWLLARSLVEVGDSVKADQVASRYAELMPRQDPRGGAIRLWQSSIVSDPATRIDRLLRMEQGSSEGDILLAIDRLRSLVDAISVELLQEVIDGIPPLGGPLMPLVEARLSVSLLELDRTADALVLARSALEGGVSGKERAWAEGVLIGEFPAGRGLETVFTIGAVLPLGGPPALAEFSSLVAQGIEVAASTALGDGFEVSVDFRDDGGDPSASLQSMRALDQAGVVGIVGFLQDDDFLAAADARARPVVLVSPTARSADRAGAAAYSLEGSDPGAAEAVARYAASRAYQRIAMVYPQTPNAEAEADAFELIAERLGMPVVGRFGYEAGATFFEPQISAALNALRSEELDRLALAPNDTLHMEELEPTALFMPIPPEDVEFLAPQIIHFGLDTLAVEILGTSGWTDPQILTSVEARLTTGVIATAPVVSERALEGQARFRDAYESRYQRSLVGATASVGYDAALLLLEALRAGRIEPDEVRESFESLEGISGATGVFSVVRGRVVRDTEVVRIEDQMAVPIERISLGSKNGRR